MKQKLKLVLLVDLVSLIILILLECGGNLDQCSCRAVVSNRRSMANVFALGLSDHWIKKDEPTMD